MLMVRAGEDADHAPHTVEDWETLFEDPDNGVIALFEKAHGIDALIFAARTLISQLLVHEDERERLRDYELALTGIEAAGVAFGEARAEVIRLLRQLEEEGKQAAGQQRDKPAKPNPGEPKPPPRQKRWSRRPHEAGGKATTTRWQFDRIGKIGIVFGVALILLFATVVAVYLYRPQLSAQERDAIVAMLFVYGQDATPDNSWQIIDARYTSGDRFELIFEIKNKEHIAKIRSMSAMERAHAAVSLCPRGGLLLDKITANHRPLWMEIRVAETVMAGATCPL